MNAYRHGEMILIPVSGHLEGQWHELFKQAGQKMDNACVIAEGEVMGEDFDDWTLTELQKRVELVQSFDRLADDIVSAYVDICKNNHIIEREILVPKTIKVLEPVA